MNPKGDRQLEHLHREPEGERRPIPLLFVHGAWHGAWCWDEHFLPYFAAHGYEVHALSLRGHGASEGHERIRWWRIADYVEDVAAVAAQLSAPPVLIGHSMGGLVVQKYLEKHAAPAAVLLASVPPEGVWRITLSIATHHPLVFIRVLGVLNLYPIVATPELAREYFFSNSMPDSQVAEYHRRLQGESFRAFLDMLALALPRPKRVNTPMLVLGAEKDTIFTVPQVRRTAKAYGTQAVIFLDMAHDMMLEPGWQAVADHIIRWLERVT